ncbi:MAG: hypothetical protein Fur0011_4490 [Candidatus Microgenomates bacterium]
MTQELLNNDILAILRRVNEEFSPPLSPQEEVVFAIVAYFNGQPVTSTTIGKIMRADGFMFNDQGVGTIIQRINQKHKPRKNNNNKSQPIILSSRSKGYRFNGILRDLED